MSLSVEDLTDAEVLRIARSLGVNQRTMLRMMEPGQARRMTFSSDQRVAESLARRKMPLLIQARSTFALTPLGKRVAEQLG